MEQEIIKIKVINTADDTTTIVELADLQSLSEGVQKTIRTAFPASLLLFVADNHNKLNVEALYKIAQSVHKIIGESLEWDIIEKMPKSLESLELCAYLVLREKTDDN
ncbi:hypothetical protein EZS27_011237 [termite gut metagenome]|uniref:Uncharacterized protein n=1 Tax=termite gut metagenome TaxID=433724 RepID=A0A5J4S580_9ZZZZ